MDRWVRTAVRSGRGYRVALAVLVLVCAPDLRAQSQGFSPAGFSSENVLAGIDSFPREAYRSTLPVIVRCQGFVEIDGRLTDYYCMSDRTDAERRVIRTVVDALGGQGFVPARLGDVPVRVLMSFSVLISCREDSCDVEPAPNHRHYVEQLGARYVAPQPILPDNNWYEGYEDKIQWIRDWMPNMNRHTPHERWSVRPVFSVEVDVNGSASGACIYSFEVLPGDDGAQSNRRRVEESLRSLPRVRFIPAFHQGEPIPLRFIENGMMRSVAKTVRNGETTRRFHMETFPLRTEAPALYCGKG